MATPSPYATSTQARFWTYTTATLGALTTERHAASRALLEGSSSSGGGSINISHISSDTIATVGGKRRERPITQISDADGSGDIGDEGAGRSVKRARSSDVVTSTTTALVIGLVSDSASSAIIGITSESSTAIAGNTHLSPSAITTSITNPPSYLTFSEEESILNWASLSLLRLCRRAPFDRAISSTALIFFQRFFSRARLVEYLPHEVM